MKKKAAEVKYVHFKGHLEAITSFLCMLTHTHTRRTSSGNFSAKSRSQELLEGENMTHRNVWGSRIHSREEFFHHSSDGKRFPSLK